MAFTTPQMGLRVWNLLTDLYDHSQLADNWAKVNYHDHSPGKGVLIPTEGINDSAITNVKIANGAVNASKLEATLDPTSAYTTFKALRHGLSVIPAGTTAATWAVSELAPSAGAVTAHLPAVFYFDPANYAATGRTTTLRIRHVLISSTATAPGVNFSMAMWPVTAVAGGSLTLGATLAPATISTPAGNSLNTAVAEFNAPAAGYYVFGLTLSGTSAGGSSVTSRVILEVRQV